MMQKTKRYPNLHTILMVEKVLINNQDMPMKISELKRKLPKQVMHNTLMLILDYLQASNKILMGSRGVQYIYVTPKHMAMMLEDALEL